MRPAMKIANPNNVPFMMHMKVYFENHTNSRHVCKRKSQNSGGTKGAVSEAESDKEEWLNLRIFELGHMIGYDGSGDSFHRSPS